MSEINYVVGDATQPITRPAIIAHVCNNKGGWGKGFSGALSAKYPKAEELYRYYWCNQYNHELGCIQVSLSSIWTVNMIAQDGYSTKRKPAIDYAALEGCLVQLCELVLDSNKRIGVHMPRIGTGLAGGDWAVIEPIIVRTLCDAGISVTVYDLPE